VITLVPNEASLGLIKWTFNTDLSKAVAEIEQRSFDVRSRSYSQYVLAGLSFFVTNMLDQRDSLRSKRVRFRRSLQSVPIALQWAYGENVSIRLSSLMPKSGYKQALSQPATANKPAEERIFRIATAPLCQKHSASDSIP
jgi:hypothetical protein